MSAYDPGSGLWEHEAREAEEDLTRRDMPLTGPGHAPVTYFDRKAFMSEMAAMPQRDAVGVERACSRVTRMVLDLLELVSSLDPEATARVDCNCAGGGYVGSGFEPHEPGCDQLSVPAASVTP